MELETFQPDWQHCGDIDEEEYISEEDDDVFAFERPITAAPRIVSETERVESPPDQAESPHTQDPVAMQNTLPDPAQNHSRNPSNLSNKPSFISASTYPATTEEDFTTDTSTGTSNPSLAKKTIKQARRMRQLLQKEILEAIPGSREGSRGVRAGDSTVPDGQTTRGDGLGNMVRQWNSEHGAERVHFEEGEEEDSPYEEVRASVSNIDDPEMPSKSISCMEDMADAW